MARIIVECDACGTKNGVDDQKFKDAICGKCKNPLQDAIEDQYGLTSESDEDDYDGDGDDDDDDDDGDDDDDLDDSEFD